VLRLPEVGPQSRGKSLAQLLELERDEQVAALIPVSDFSAERPLVFLTASGLVKRTGLDQFAGIRAGGIAAIKLRQGDRLLDVQLSDGTGDVVLVTRGGRAIRFPEVGIPLMGRATQGVKGIELRSGDAVVGMVVVRREATLCTVTEQGFAKRTAVHDYPIQRRGGMGSTAMEVSDRTGPLVGAKELLHGDELMVISASGAAARVAAAAVPVQGRTTMGKRVLQPAPGDRVVEVTRVARARDGEDGGGGGGGGGGGSPGAGAGPGEATGDGTELAAAYDEGAEGPEQLDLMRSREE
jgi:DNA gyrase subunit A